MKDFLNILIKKYKKLKNRKFHRKLRAEKSRMYLRDDDSSSFNSRKNKFKIFSLTRKYINFVNLNNHKYTAYYYYIAIFLFILSAYIFLFSSYFSVQKIYIERNDDITNINIAYKSVEDLYWDSIVLLDENEVINKMKSYQKNIKTIDFRKMFPDSVKITLTSYKAAFNTKLFDREYLITNNWIFVPIKNDPKLKNMIVHFKDKDTLWIVDYKAILNSNDIIKSNNIVNKINTSIFAIKIKDIDYFPTEKELHINTDNGTKYIFDLTWNIDEQLAKLTNFVEKYKDIINWWLYYTDLRISGKIFYCPISEKNQCQKNLKIIYWY